MSLERVIHDAKINFSQLNQVVLVGGTTHMPLICKLMTRLFGRVPVVHLNPDEITAQGAAIQVVLKMRHSELRDVVVTDVYPHTLGADTSKSLGHARKSGYFISTIECNRSIPYSRVRVFYMAHDQRTGVSFEIYQGESRMVADNIFLAELSANVPPKPVGDVCIDIRFMYDVNGIFDADISVPLTGAKNSLVIEQNPGTLMAERIQQSLSKLSLLEIHPRDEQMNQAFIVRLDDLYQFTLAETRDWISNCSRHFSYLLEKQDPDQPAGFRTKVEPTLGSLERGRLQWTAGRYQFYNQVRENEILGIVMRNQ